MYVHIISLTSTSCLCNAGPNLDVKRGIGLIIHILQQPPPWYRRYPARLPAADVHSNGITNCKQLLMQHGSNTDAASAA
jgi:hypothetical protein